ncbi:MAG: glycosyltransferase family 39 protein [Candidatus Riflebacteria bacterium]|nr:glycosyltransferase family 39 protein [Candidatus Riflebacteria bacterium]
MWRKIVNYGSESSKIIFFLLLLGFFLRFFHLSDQSLWEDELASLKVAQLPLTGILHFSPEMTELNPPLYFVLLHYCIKFFGYSEMAIRLISVLSGTFSILLIYLVGKKLFTNNTGTIAALILCLSPFHIRYSQEARNYSLLVFFALLSIYFLLKLVNKYNLKNAVGYSLSTILLLYTGTVSIFVWLAQNFFVFFHFFWKKEKKSDFYAKSWLKIQLVVAISWALWIPELVRQSSSISQGWWLSPPTLEGLYFSFLEFCGGLSSVTGTNDFDFSGPLMLATLFSILCLLSPFEIKEIIPVSQNNDFFPKPGFRHFIDEMQLQVRVGKFESIFLCIILIFSCFLLPFILSFLVKPIFMSRYVIIASLGIFLLAAQGTFALPKTGGKAISIVCIVVFSVLGIIEYFSVPIKPEWRKAASYAQEKTLKGETIVVSSARCKNSFAYYFPEERNEIIPFPVSKGMIDSETMSELFPRISKENKVLLVISRNVFGDVNLLLSEMNKYFRPVSAIELFGIQIIEFKKHIQKN